MLGILLIFFVGKYFYKLAEDYHKSKWLYAILGIIIYYASGFAFGIVLGILDVALGWGIDWDNAYGIGLLGIPIGIAGCYIFYIILQKQWKKEPVIVKDEIEDIGKTTQEDSDHFSE